MAKKSDILYYMITSADIDRIISPDLQMRRIKNAENRCKNAQTDWGKDFWYKTFKALCEKYDKMTYFRKAIH